MTRTALPGGSFAIKLQMIVVIIPFGKHVDDFVIARPKAVGPKGMPVVQTPGTMFVTVYVSMHSTRRLPRRPFRAPRNDMEIEALFNSRQSAYFK